MRLNRDKPYHMPDGHVVKIDVLVDGTWQAFNYNGEIRWRGRDNSTVEGWREATVEEMDAQYRAIKEQNWTRARRRG